MNTEKSSGANWWAHKPSLGIFNTRVPITHCSLHLLLQRRKLTKEPFYMPANQIPARPPMIPSPVKYNTASLTETQKIFAEPTLVLCMSNLADTRDAIITLSLTVTTMFLLLTRPGWIRIQIISPPSFSYFFYIVSVRGSIHCICFLPMKHRWWH